MGRPKQAYSLYPRKYADKVIWYYRTYSPDGQRTTGKSTGETSRTKARQFCEELVKKGDIFKGKPDYFDTFAKDLFTEGSEWYKEKYRNSKPSLTYLPEKTYRMNKYLMPVFGRKKIKDITKRDIINFQDSMLSSGISAGFVKSCSQILNQILDYAVRCDIVASNVMAKVPPLVVNYKKRDSMSEEEAVKFLHSPIQPRIRMASIVAACTGLRIGEVRAIRMENIHEDWLDVRDQIQSGELTETKTKETRIVPLCPELREFMVNNLNPFGWMFSFEIHAFQRDFKTGLKKAEVENVEDRLLSFHSWRHFFNTYMLSHIPGSEPKIAAIMGHRTGSTAVRDVYTNFKKEDLNEILEWQSKLFHMLAD